MSLHEFFCLSEVLYIIMLNVSLKTHVIVGMHVRMAMSSEVQSQLSKHNTLAIAGNLEVKGNSGGGAATAVFRHQISPVSSVELIASTGVHSLIGVHTSR